MFTLWTFHVHDAEQVVLLFVPSSTILSLMIDLKPDDRKVFTWDEWGPNGTRMMKVPMGHSFSWVSFVYGMTYLAPIWAGDRWGFQLYDFNKLGLRRRFVDADSESPGGHDDYLVARSTVWPPGTFSTVVTTSLPYRCRQLKLHQPLAPNSSMLWQAVLLSEDSIIAVGYVSVS